MKKSRNLFMPLNKFLDIDVFYNRIIIDAKSMLGVLSLDLSRELTVKYGGKNNAFENVLCKYACA